MRTLQHVVLLGILGVVAVENAAAQLTAEKFKAAVGKQVAPPIGTFQSEGKWKGLCVCNSVDAVGVLETNTSGIPRLGIACIVPSFNADGSMGSTAPCLDWTPLTK